MNLYLSTTAVELAFKIQSNTFPKTKTWFIHSPALFYVCENLKRSLAQDVNRSKCSMQSYSSKQKKPLRPITSKKMVNRYLPLQTPPRSCSWCWGKHPIVCWTRSRQLESSFRQKYQKQNSSCLICAFPYNEADDSTEIVLFHPFASASQASYWPPQYARPTRSFPVFARTVSRRRSGSPYSPN